MTGIKNPIAGVSYRDPALARQYLASGAWLDLTVGEALKKNAERHPERPAYIADDRSISFAELDAETDRLAAALLDLGLAPGDRALFQMGTNVEIVLALVACYKIGVIPVCSVPQYREVEIGHLTRQSEAKGYFVEANLGSTDLIAFARRMMDEHASLRHLIVARASAQEAAGAPRLESLIENTSLEYARERLGEVEIGSEDVLSFQLSGGSTGIPKIIPRFHGEYLGHSVAWMRQFGVTEDSRLLWTLPLIHNAGQVYALMPVLLLGVTAVLMSTIDVPRMMKLLERHRVTHTLSIGPIAPQLMAYDEIGRHDLSSLELFATLSRAESLEQHIGIPCSQFYGITEGLVMNAPPDAPAFVRHETQGRSGCPDDQIRLLKPESEDPVAHGEMGELCIKGPSTLMSYYANPEATAEAFTSDGFFRTGDMVTAHQVEGQIYYSFEGRLRDNINRGGEKIGCEEVEAYISMHPAVADAKLVAMPDPMLGERGCAYLIPRRGHQAPQVPELVEFLTGKGLAKFKCPERIEVVDQFPVTRVGKLDKVALRADIARKLEQEQAEIPPGGSLRSPADD